MFERILIPLDGSRLAERILVQVGKILRRKDSEVILVRAAPSLPEIPTVQYAAMIRQEEEVAGEYLRGVAEQLRASGVNARTKILKGHPVDVIRQAVEVENATMIAMTTHGRTGLTRWTLGSVAEMVARNSQVPVLLLRSFTQEPSRTTTEAREEEAPFGRILVPTDGSERALGVWSFVEEFALLFEAEVVLLRVEAPGNHSPLDLVNSACDILEKSAHPNACQLLSAKLAEKGIRVRHLVATGDPASEIVDRSVSESADLIAMTTQGRSGLSKWLLGSVAERVLRGARTPILLVRVP